MLLDFRSVDAATRIESDLCIIGAGAAGIALALEFAGSGVDVCLIESGGLTYEDDTQALYDGDSVGLFYPLTTSRLRYFGGTTNHWTGHCWPLTEIDLAPRSWVPHSGWPIDRASLEPYYRRAQSVCRLGPYIYDERLWERVPAAPPAFRPSQVEVRFWQEPPPVRFGAAYRSSLERAPDVTVLLHANVTALETNDSASSVTHVALRTLDGREGSVAARRFVLACGGIENPRILLLSNRHRQAGLGNDRDLVGRFFMEHPHVYCGSARLEHGSALQTAFCQPSHLSDPDGRLEPTPFYPALCPSPELQERERILNASFRVYAELAPDSGVAAAQRLSRSARRREVPDDLGSILWNITRDLVDVVRAATGGESRPAQLLSFFARSESAPDPESRVTLGDDVDALGLRRARLDWSVGELDRRSLRLSMMAIAQELGRLEIARVQLPEWLTDEAADWRSQWAGGNHHMGTTRMSSDPASGVVDANCRVHGVGNLYVAGSSVFPTSGFANPTLTLVALALRLADHLKEDPASEPAG